MGNMRPGASGISGEAGRARYWVLVFLAVLPIVVYLAVRSPRKGGVDPGNLAAGPVPAAAGEQARAAGSPATSAAATTPSTTSGPKWTPPRFTERQGERDEMVRVIRDSYGLRDEKILKVMAAVPRHEFVLERYLSRAYADTPLPIGYAQTISQPYMVAEMTRLLKLKPTSRVLEIGTGSGYQAAVLAHLTAHVYSIEIVKPLAASAGKRLKRLGYTAVTASAGDGYYGWPKMTFDAIIVTAAAGSVPRPLLRQLAPGGRMVIPVGGPFTVQTLMLIEKRPDGTLHSRSLMAVRFVPMLGAVEKQK